MLHTTYKIGAFMIALLLGGMALQGCHHAENADDQKEEKFQVTDTLLNSLLIDTVKEASALSQINLTGSIAPDELLSVASPAEAASGKDHRAAGLCDWPEYPCQSASDHYAGAAGRTPR